ncbi:MAG: TetR family transcriptional regulator [Micropruina sp.]|uniref:TetR family transcriptional regulator n=1 Tax=Micropruina sp. TaxID=2737536 RepID=UPI0039E6442A
MARAEQRERTRSALLIAAATEFDEHGFAATTLGDVAARLGLVRATVHFHFATKEQLAEAVVRQELEAWELLRRTSLDVEAEPLSRLRWVSGQVARRYASDPVTRAAIRLLDEHRVPRLDPAPASGWTTYVADQLRAARVAGAVPAQVDPELDAGLLVGMFRGLLPSLTEASESARTEELVDLFCHYALAGLNAR